jgi:uncharacterized membrane protein YeaQ/YmgE (transglycosylase-associated protein family)
MPTTPSSPLNYPPVAERFLQPPFRSGIFRVVTAAFFGMLIMIFVANLKQAPTQNLEVLVWSLLGALSLVWAWRRTLRVYTSMRELFYNGQIEKFEKDSALGKVIANASELIRLLPWVIIGGMAGMVATLIACAHRH